SEIDGRSSDPAVRAAELERIQAAQVEVKQALSQIEGDTRPVHGGSSVPSLIMQAFLEMGLKQDADVLAFASQTAADDALAYPVHGQTLHCLDQLVGEDDLVSLYGYLESPSAMLQARALQAIATLQSRLSASGSKE